MTMRSKVRQRRQDRIKKIVHENQYNGYEPDDEDDLETVRLLDERLNDPEYVWKMNHNNLNHDSNIGTLLKYKLVLCLLLFTAIWGIFQVDYPWAKVGQEL